MKSKFVTGEKITENWKWITLYVVPGLVLYFDFPSNQFQVLVSNLGIWIQHQWDRVLDLIGDDTFNLYTYGMNIFSILLYWFFGLLYLMVDLLAWPKWVVRYKVQPTANIDKKRIRSLIANILCNQLFVSVPFSVFGYYVLEYQGTSPPVRELPTFLRLTRDFALLIPIQEVFAYYTHRMFHHRLLYKWTHKVHHEWTAPVALTALYNHPLDHLVINIFSTTIGISILNSHFFTSWLWITFSTLRAINEHSGYHLFTFQSPQRHDFHHMKFNECFGIWGLLDYLHGTDTHFRAQLNSRQSNKKSTQL